jgi:hypothetical protein
VPTEGGYFFEQSKKNHRITFGATRTHYIDTTKDDSVNHSQTTTMKKSTTQRSTVKNQQTICRVGKDTEIPSDCPNASKHIAKALDNQRRKDDKAFGIQLGLLALCGLSMLFGYLLKSNFSGMTGGAGIVLQSFHYMAKQLIGRSP